MHDKHRNVIVMIASMLCFALVDVIAKYLIGDYPPNEISFFRLMVGLVPAFGYLRAGKREISRSMFATKRTGGHVVCAVLALASMALFFGGLRYIQLAEAVALNYTEAIFVILLAAPLLHERLRAKDLGVALVAFTGVVLILQPSTSGFSWYGPTLILASALLGAGWVIQIKRLSRTDDSALIVFYFTLYGAAISGASLPWGWKTPDMVDLFLLCSIGVLGSIGQILMATALKTGGAAELAPFNYTTVLWATLFGYLLWDEHVGSIAAVGIALVILGSLYLALEKKPDIPDPH